MCKASAISNATRPGYSEIGNAETGTYVDGAGTINNDRLDKSKKQSRHCNKRETNKRQ